MHLSCRMLTETYQRLSGSFTNSQLYLLLILMKLPLFFNVHAVVHHFILFALNPKFIVNRAIVLIVDVGPRGG